MLFIVSDPHLFAVSIVSWREFVRGQQAVCSLNFFWVAADQFPFCRYFNCSNTNYCPENSISVPILVSLHKLNIPLDPKTFPSFSRPANNGGWIGLKKIKKRKKKNPSVCVVLIYSLNSTHIYISRVVVKFWHLVFLDFSIFFAMSWCSILFY